MVIFHSYVSLPEGIHDVGGMETLWQALIFAKSQVLFSHAAKNLNWALVSNIVRPFFYRCSWDDDFH